MLRTLNRVPLKERGPLLAAAADRLLPRPRFEDDTPANWPSAELVEEVLTEARKAANIREGDNSADTQRQLLQFLTRSISAQLLERNAERAARERLGAKGGLELGAYEVKFRDDFDEEGRRTGIRKKEVREAIRQPDNVQHFAPLGEDSSDLVTLATVTQDQPISRNTLLVETQRKKDTLLVCNVWRGFHSDLDVTRVRKPLDFLRSFLDVFGLDVILANRDRSRLIEREAIPVQGLPADSKQFVQSGFLLKLISVPDWRPGAPFHVTSHLRISPLGVLEVQLCYAVDTARYHARLREHGLGA